MDQPHLHRIKDPWNPCVVSQPPADNLYLTSKLIDAAGVRREKSLARGIQAVDQARQPPLPAMGVAGQDKIKRKHSVNSGQLRP